MRRPRSQLTLALVGLVLGILVVVQARAQSGGSVLDTLSAQDLTILVANLSARNDQLRTEIATLEVQAAGLVSAQARGDTSLDDLRSDLARVEAWSGTRAVTGPGVKVIVGGPIAGAAIEDLLNELRNAGAEAFAIGDVRIVAGSVVAGAPGELSVENTPLGDPFEVSAIGNPETLTGSLTRAGGIVAQLKATFPDATITVVPVDRLELPATARRLVPSHGRPRL